MMTFAELWDLYFERHVKARLKRTDNAHYFYKCHGSHWAETPVPEITRGQLQDWIDTLGATRGQSGANRAINQMAAVINWGIRRGYFVGFENPCRYVDRFDEVPRSRFLLPEEIDRFRNALEQEPPIMRDFFWMCLLTGARRGNVASMRWDKIDMQLAIWTIPAADFKNRSEHIIALSQAALAVLQRRANAPVTSAWVFPSKGKTGHIVEPKRAWARVMKRSGLDDVRIHDLRRTVGSYLAIQGADGFLIAKILGHKDLRSTAVYARLNLDPARKALERIQTTMLS